MIRPSQLTDRTVPAPDHEPDIEITRLEAALPGLPEESEGLTLVQISDLHRGMGRTDRLIEAAVRRVGELAPDVVVITGDFVDGPRRDILPVVRMVSELRARRGVYAVLGNHDHRGDPVLLRNALDAAGVRVLHNTAVEAAPGLWLAGVDDLYEGEPDLEAALRPVPARDAAILLAHHPGAIERVSTERPLLILSGHTHGGQIVLPWPTPEMICWKHLRTRYVHGWYANGDVRLYVNRGVGVTGGPFLARRHRCRPEISRFQLVSASLSHNMIGAASARARR